jgi:hypothetical protein
MESISHLALLQILDELPVPALLAAAQVCRRWRDALADPARWAHVDDRAKWKYLAATCRGAGLPSVQLAVARFRISVAKMRHQLFHHGGRLEVVQWMAGHCAKTLADLRNEDMHSIEVACLSGRADVARWLIDRFEPTKEDLFNNYHFLDEEFGGVFATCCSNERNRDLLEHLIGRYDDINFMDLVRNHAIALRAAAQGGNLEWLLDRLDAPAFILCARDPVRALGCLRDTEALSRVVAAVPLEPEHGVALLCIACGRGDLESAQMLVRHFAFDAETIRRINHGFPMYEACASGHVAVATWLADVVGLDLIDDILPQNSLCTICARGHRAMLEWLVERYRSDVHATIHSQDFRIVFAAVGAGHTAIFHRLLELGTINKVMFRMCIPTQLTIHPLPTAAKLESVQAALAFAEVTATDLRRWDWIVLSHACSSGHQALAKWIVDHFGATPADIRASTCVEEAMLHGRAPIVRWLVERFSLTLRDLCADQDDEDETNVDRLLRVCHEDDVLWLFDRFAFTGEHIDATTFRKACSKGFLRLARAIAAVARPSNAEARDAIGRAEANGHDEVVDWLREEFDIYPGL